MNDGGKSSRADDFKEIIGILAYGRPTNGVPPHKCLALAPLVGDCEFKFFNDLGALFCQISWEDGSRVVIGLEDE